MNYRKPQLALMAIVLLALSACSSAGDTEKTLSITGGTIEMAASELCADTTNPQCVSVGGQVLLAPSEYRSASVASAAFDPRNAARTIDVKFDTAGARVFRDLTAEVSSAGDHALLVMKFGDKKMVAVTVPEVIDRDQVQIALPPDEDAHQMLELIRRT